MDFEELTSMHTLYHHQLCPISRQIRVYLQEFNIEVNYLREDYWLMRPEFIKLSPAAATPVLMTEQRPIVGYYAIIEYLLEIIPDFFFIPEDIWQRAKTRQYIEWFNSKFHREVSKLLVDEKMIRLLLQQGQPRSAFIHSAKQNLAQHLKLLHNLLTQNSFIISDKITAADITAAAHISVIDYFGEVNWDSYELIKQWYAVIKSRPAFQLLLKDYIPGFLPPTYYRELDF